jgi:uncharacterized metal-binding protein
MAQHRSYLHGIKLINMIVKIILIIMMVLVVVVGCIVLEIIDIEK